MSLPNPRSAYGLAHPCQTQPGTGSARFHFILHEDYQSNLLVYVVITWYLQQTKYISKA